MVRQAARAALAGLGLALATGPLGSFVITEQVYVHSKLLIVDGRVGFTGGVGIADVWSGNAEDPEHWRDMHFSVRGPAVSQLQAAFNDNWIKSTGEILHGETYFPPQSEAGEMDAQMFISSPVGGGATMHLMYLMAIAAAEQSLDIQASYFVPDELALEAMLAAIGATDDPYAARRDTYLARRAREIAELKGEAVAEPQPPTEAAPAEPQANTSGLPPPALAEQIQLTARRIPATR